SVTWLARQIPCTRNNMYKIFRKSNLDTTLLQHISQILDYNFFDDYFKKQ
ncbi:MAG: XRE family transcriptional regulator, partial [Sphingobacteriia bacterium]|nr:XRE family transcriptional regulator [Sphingobacteriia bacterium]